MCIFVTFGKTVTYLTVRLTVSSRPISVLHSSRSFTACL